MKKMIHKLKYVFKVSNPDLTQILMQGYVSSSWSPTQCVCTGCELPEAGDGSYLTEEKLSPYL